MKTFIGSAIALGSTVTLFDRVSRGEGAAMSPETGSHHLPDAEVKALSKSERDRILETAYEAAR